MFFIYMPLLQQEQGYNTLTISYYDSRNADTIAYNSIANSVRLVDVMRQVTKSISGLQINAPRFEALGSFTIIGY
jgi:hypothetical protein